MVLTYGEVRDWDADTVDEAGNIVRKRKERLLGLGDDLAATAVSWRWSGDAATAVRQKIRNLNDRAEHFVAEASSPTVRSPEPSPGSTWQLGDVPDMTPSSPEGGSDDEPRGCERDRGPTPDNPRAAIVKTQLARRGLTLSRVTVSVVTALCVSITASCNAPVENEGDRVSTEAQKSGAGELRTDEEPLTKRFSVLEAPLEVQWMSGTYGNPRNPGPSTYWIDAVITLGDDQIDDLTASYSPASTDQTPSVVEGMQEYLPSGPFQTSDTLNAAFKEGRWWAHAYLDPQSDKLVLIATGT